MAKTMRNIVITCVVLIVVAIGASVLLLSGGCGKTKSDPFAQTRADAANAVLDASGVKGHLDAKLREQAGNIAEQAGIPLELADKVVDDIDVKDWTVVPLPDNAVETAHFTVDADGTPIGVTTYDDTSIVTLDAYGQEFTMQAPESARDYTPYLRYLENIENLRN